MTTTETLLDKIAEQFEESVCAVESNGDAQTDAGLDAGDLKASAQAQDAVESYAKGPLSCGRRLLSSGRDGIGEIDGDFFPIAPPLRVSVRK